VLFFFVEFAIDHLYLNFIGHLSPNGDFAMIDDHQYWAAKGAFTFYADNCTNPNTQLIEVLADSPAATDSRYQSALILFAAGQSQREMGRVQGNLFVAEKPQALTS